MGYNDYFDSFDTKKLDFLKEEYAKKYSDNASLINVLQVEQKDNLEHFFKKYERLLDVLFYINKRSKSAGCISKNNQFQSITKSLCGLYFNLKGGYYFSPLASVLGDSFDAKKQLFFAIKEVLKSPFYLIKEEAKNVLIEQLIFLVKYCN